MLTEDAIQERLKEAMRARASDRVLVLRGLVAAIKNRKIERRTEGQDDEIGDAEITQIIRREIKQREEAIAFAERGKRADLVDKNRTEKAFLEGFLPQAVGAEEMNAAIARHHREGAKTVGALMAKLKGDFGARLDGRAASDAVRKFLQNREGS